MALVFVAVLATHLTYEFFSNGDFFYPDSYTYLTPAANLVHGHFTGEEGPEVLRTPGYPLFLVPFLALQAPARAIVAFQHLLDALLAAAIFALARRAGASRGMAAAGALVIALDTITIHYANKILTETVSAIVLFAIVAFVLNARTPVRLLIAGLLCGALVLVRPVAIAYFIVVIFWLVFVRAGTRAIAVFFIAAIALPVAWASRNAAATGHFTISTIGSANLLMHRAAGALAMEDGGDFKQRHSVRMQQLQKIVDRMVTEGEGLEPDEVESADLAPYYDRLARQVLLQHPRGAALVTLRGLWVNVAESDWEAMKIVSRIDPGVVEIAIGVWTWLLWIAAIGGLVIMGRRDAAPALLIAATILYFLLMAAGGEAEARFRTPVVPLMALAVTTLSRSPRRYSTSRPTSSRASDRTESR